VLLLVFKLPNANVIATADRVKAKLSGLEAYFPSEYPSAGGLRPYAHHPSFGQ
jgi:multidrug efflux pump subunit AcrB